MLPVTSFSMTRMVQNGGEFVMVWGYDAWRECIQAHVYKLLSTILSCWN